MLKRKDTYLTPIGLFILATFKTYKVVDNMVYRDDWVPAWRRCVCLVDRLSSASYH